MMRFRIDLGMMRDARGGIESRNARYAKSMVCESAGAIECPVQPVKKECETATDLFDLLATQHALLRREMVLLMMAMPLLPVCWPWCCKNTTTRFAFLY
jgi:hypothetical protein